MDGSALLMPRVVTGLLMVGMARLCFRVSYTSSTNKKSKRRETIMTSACFSLCLHQELQRKLGRCKCSRISILGERRQQSDRSKRAELHTSKSLAAVAASGPAIAEQAEKASGQMGSLVQMCSDLNRKIANLQSTHFFAKNAFTSFSSGLSASACRQSSTSFS